MLETLGKFGRSGIGISLIAGFVLTILGPYNTASLSLAVRFMYWTGLCFAGSLGAAMATPLLTKIGKGESKIWIVILQSVLGAVVVTAFLIGLDISLSGSAGFQSSLITFFYVWIISITITGIAHLVDSASNSNEPPANTRPDIFERLKPALRSADIYALTAEDHYVRVITSKGEDLILMRLSDAIKELGNLKGLSVHRSWWVSETGVQSVKKTNGKMSITLQSSQTVPVSRSNMKLVKEAGWS